MRILVLVSHPAQFFFFKNPVANLRKLGHTVFILIKTKDILQELLDNEGWEYYNILPRGRGKSRFSMIKSLVIRDIKIFLFSIRNRIDLFTGTDASLPHVAKALRKPCITTLEDDYQVIRNLARLNYPFTQNILAPDICDTGRWSFKKTGYKGYMKLSYLHPGVFTPHRAKLNIPSETPFFLIRLSALTAHHDFGIKGIREEFLKIIIERLRIKGNVYLSSEKKLPDCFSPYLLRIPVWDIHHYLSYAEMLICDSQSMAVEAAMLGTPSIRISSFSGRISVLEELEHVYQLTYGFLPEDETLILKKTDELMTAENLRETFQTRRKRMLSDKINVAAFVTWYLDNYPESRDIMKDNPDYQYRFQ